MPTPPTSSLVLYEIHLCVGDILYDGFDTSLLFHAPLDCALDDLKLRYEINDTAVVLVNDEAVNRTWYQLQPGDVIRILSIVAPAFGAIAVDSESSSKEVCRPASFTAKRTDSSKKPEDDEANLIIKRFLKDNPKATIRQVAREVGLSTGKVNGLEAWRNVMAERNAARPQSKAKERPLTKKILQSVGRDDDPAKQAIRNEAIWNYLMMNADRTKREELLMMAKEQRDELIQLTWSQLHDELPPDLQELE